MQSCPLVCLTYLRLRESKIKLIMHAEIHFTMKRVRYAHMLASEEVVQVYGICICMLHLLVISVTIIGVMRLSQWKSHVRRFFGTICSELCLCERPFLQDMWSRVHIVIETAVTATVVMWEHCKSRVQLEASEIGEIQVPVAHELKVLSRLDLHQVKDLFLYFLKILTWSASDLVL